MFELKCFIQYGFTVHLFVEVLRRRSRRPQTNEVMMGFLLLAM